MTPAYPRLVFDFEFDERAAYEAESRGYLGFARVEIGEDRSVPVVFYSVVRLAQDLEEEERVGRVFIADPGMIVLRRVTRALMEKAVAELYELKYFEAFRSGGRD